ncbi:MAG: hypothetical protein AMXMBFR33_31090 [Candidatus Xenobia bacterium]
MEALRAALSSPDLRIRLQALSGLRGPRIFEADFDLVGLLLDHLGACRLDGERLEVLSALAGSSDPRVLPCLLQAWESAPDDVALLRLHAWLGRRPRHETRAFFAGWLHDRSTRGRLAANALCGHPELLAPEERLRVAFRADIPIDPGGPPEDALKQVWLDCLAHWPARARELLSRQSESCRRLAAWWDDLERPTRLWLALEGFAPESESGEEDAALLAALLASGRRPEERLLSHPCGAIRAVAIRAGVPLCEPALLLSQETELEVRLALARRLGEAEPEERVKAAVELLHEDHWQLRAIGAELLSGVAERSVRPLLSDARPQVRAAAARVLERKEKAS